MRDAAFQIVLSAARKFVCKAATVNLPGAIIVAPNADASTVSPLLDCTPESTAHGSTREPQKKFRLRPVQANLAPQSDF